MDIKQINEQLQKYIKKINENLPKFIGDDNNIEIIYPENAKDNIPYFVLKRGSRFVHSPGLMGFVTANQYNGVKVYTQDQIGFFYDNYPKVMSSLTVERIN